MELGLEHKVALITGGSQGIGLATARLLREEGAKVAIVARGREGVETALEELGRDDDLLGLTGDMGLAEEAEAAVAQTIDRFGHVDVLVTCAGSSPGGLVENLTEEQYGPHGIRVNTVNPGPVDTGRWDLLEKQMAKDRGITQPEAHDLAVSSIPLGRICKPEEVANLVAFVASPRASFVNGAHIPIDGAQRKALMD